MEFIGIIFALFFAIILTAIFSLPFRNTGPWGGFWVFFILLFFISLGAGEWAAPRGPSAWGYYWAPGLIAAVIFALLLAAAAPGSSSKPRKRNLKSTAPTQEMIDESEEAIVATTVIGIFFWILIIALALIAIAGIFG